MAEKDKQAKELIVDKSKETIRVRALKAGFIKGGWDPVSGRCLDHRVHGDDELGYGNGDVFDLFPYLITITDKEQRPVRDKATGQVQKRLLTAEEQFSALWMERVDPDTPVTREYMSSQESLAEKQRSLGSHFGVGASPNRRGVA